MGKRKENMQFPDVASVCDVLDQLSDIIDFGKDIAGLLECEFRNCVEVIGQNERRFKLSEECVSKFVSALIILGTGNPVDTMSLMWETVTKNGTRYTVETLIETNEILSDSTTLDDIDVYDSIIKYADNKKYEFDFTINGGVWKEISEN